MRREKGKPRLCNKRVVLNGLVWKFGTKKGQHGDVLAMEISHPRVLGFSMCSALKHRGTGLFLLLPGGPKTLTRERLPPPPRQSGMRLRFQEPPGERPSCWVRCRCQASVNAGWRAGL